MDYNLLEEQWIPVLWNNGKYDRVNIKDALIKASQIRQIATSNPMDRVAILRFLLALLYWCKGNPPDAAISGDLFPGEWFYKLDQNKDHFNLLGGGNRFYQDPTAQRCRPVTDLIQEIPTGNNFWHFRHSTDMEDGFCPACCAMGLLRLPLFSVSGLPDLYSGINGTPPVYVLSLGTSLLATLRANWKVFNGNVGDPAWINPRILINPGHGVPLLTGLTLLSRRVWLHDPSEPGLCIGCGARSKVLIQHCEFQSAGKQENDRWNDPHVVYSGNVPRSTEKAPDLTTTLNFRMDRPWPELLTHVAATSQLGQEEGQQLLLFVGFATRQALNIDAWKQIIAMPPIELIDDASPNLIRQWVREGSGLTRKCRTKEKLSSREYVEISSAIAAIRPHVESRVSLKLNELLISGPEAWQDAAREYGPLMNAISQSLSPGFTIAAVERRQQIAGALPNMRI